MNTVTLRGNPVLAGQGLAFEGDEVRANFQTTDPLTARWSIHSYDWNIDGRIVQTPPLWWSQDYGSYTVGQADVGKMVSVTANGFYQAEKVSVGSTRPLTVMNVNDLPVGSLRVEGDTRSAGSVLAAVG